MWVLGIWLSASFGLGNPVLDCVDSIPESWETDPVESETGTIDSCPEFHPHREQGRATLALSRIPGSSTRTIFRHTASSQGWHSRIELRNDTLWRRQFAWETGGWKLLAGDMTDTSMPLLDPWLPRRALPEGWKPASGGILPVSPALQGLGAGVFRQHWKAYALRCANPVGTGREPPWMDAWDFRHFAAGGEVEFPWRASMRLSETRISRSGVDSVAEHRFDLGLASPDARLKVNGAWMEGAASGGFAFGIRLRQPFGDSGGLGLTVRQREAGWNTVWDPAWASAAPEVDTTWGAGEFAVSLRVPVATEAGHAWVEGEGWQAWNPAMGTRRAGMRGEAFWRGEAASVSVRAAHGQYTGENGARFNRQFSLRTSVGKKLEWTARVWSTWTDETTQRGMRLEAEMFRRGFHVRPGVELTGVNGTPLEIVCVLWTRMALGGGWTLEGRGEAPQGFSTQTLRFNLALHYQGKPGQ